MRIILITLIIAALGLKPSFATIQKMVITRPLTIRNESLSPISIEVQALSSPTLVLHPYKADTSSIKNEIAFYRQTYLVLFVFVVGCLAAATNAH